MTVATELAAPIYSYEDLRRRADELLVKHHPVGTIPIPIEEIVEFQLRIDIVPMPGLHRLIETDGFITSDLQEIYVDEFVLSASGTGYTGQEVGHRNSPRTVPERAISDRG